MKFSYNSRDSETTASNSPTCFIKQSHESIRSFPAYKKYWRTIKQTKLIYSVNSITTQKIGESMDSQQLGRNRKSKKVDSHDIR